MQKTFYSDSDCAFVSSNDNPFSVSSECYKVEEEKYGKTKIYYRQEYCHQGKLLFYDFIDK